MGAEEEERQKGDEGGRNFSGNDNRWSKEETLALLKIRSDMETAFRDSIVKSPLWEEVARKLNELGYDRSAKKCREKFENIYKYHKRTKDGQSGGQSGKNYRFFKQLEAFNTQPSVPLFAFSEIRPSVEETTTAVPITMIQPIPVVDPVSIVQDVTTPRSIQNPTTELMSTSTSTTPSSGKESEGNVKKKRKLGDFFERLMKQVLEKQDNLQNKFFEAIEKCEKDRIEREELWRTQEMARVKKEQEMLAHERAVATAKHAAVMALLQKISEQGMQPQKPEIPMTVNSARPEKIIINQENDFGENFHQVSSSRWPKAEVEALIRLRTNFDMQYQDNGAKGPLWEEISIAMKKLGYDKSAKKCKEKWENINKYFKRVKESNKRRPEDAKTCPYFHLLEPLYKRKSKKIDNSDGCSHNLKPEGILMQMMKQQQQQQQQQFTQRQSGNSKSENVHQNEEDDGEDYEDNYQIVANNTSSVAAME